MINRIKKKLHQHENLTLYIAMISVIIATFVVIAFAPLPANAEYSHKSWTKTKHSEFFDKHMATLHDELKLSDAQEKAWTIFIDESKSTDQAPIPSRSELSKLTTPERLDRMLSIMKVRQQNMVSHAQSVKGFYRILTAEQQRVFDASYHAFRTSMKNANHSPLPVTA